MFRFWLQFDPAHGPQRAWPRTPGWYQPRHLRLWGRWNRRRTDRVPCGDLSWSAHVAAAADRRPAAASDHPGLTWQPLCINSI